MSTTNKQCDNKNSYQRHQSALLYTVKASILVLRVDLFYVVDDVVVQCSAEQPVLASQQSETKLKQRRRRNKTFTTQHHQRLTERLQQTHQMQNARSNVLKKHWSDPTVPLKLRPYGTVEIQLLSFSLSFHFKGHFPGEPGLADVYWSKGWWRWWWQLNYGSYKSCKAPVKSSSPTNQHPVF